MNHKNNSNKIRQPCDATLLLTDQFKSILENCLNHYEQDYPGNIILSFINPKHSVEGDNYQLVEITLNSEYELLHMSDQSYVGFGYRSEIVRELQFDFKQGAYHQRQEAGGDYFTEQAVELFSIWQERFCHCYQNGVFQVSVTAISSGR